jgi:hypothetical protein
MARPSKLSDKQWADVERRLLAGEIPAALAKEYGIDRAAITRKFSQQLRNVKTVAKQIVETDTALRSLPVAQQVQAISLADELKAISMHLATSAKHGSAASSKLNSMMHAEVQRFQDGAQESILKGESPLNTESIENLKGIGALSRLANSASEIGLNLLKANKETVDGLNKAEEKPEPKQIIFTVQDARA